MLLTVYVKPHAATESVEWIDDETLRVCVRALAEKGKANAAVIALLSKKFGIKKSNIEIVRGHTIQIKHIKIPELHRFRLLTKDGNE